MADEAPEEFPQQRARVAPTVTVPPNHAQHTFHESGTPKPTPSVDRGGVTPTLRGVTRTPSEAESLSPPIRATTTAGEVQETMVRLAPVVILALSMLIFGAVAGYAVGWTRAIAVFENTFGVELTTHP